MYPPSRITGQLHREHTPVRHRQGLMTANAHDPAHRWHPSPVGGVRYTIGREADVYTTATHQGWPPQSPSKNGDDSTLLNPRPSVESPLSSHASNRPGAFTITCGPQPDTPASAQRVPGRKVPPKASVSHSDDTTPNCALPGGATLRDKQADSGARTTGRNSTVVRVPIS